MKLKNLRSLLAWELEEYMSFPILELILFTAIFSILNQPILEISPSKSYSNLHWGIQNVFLFLIFVIATVLSRNFAGSYAKGEIKMLLSYPVKRWQLFFSKFMAMFLMFCTIYGAIFSFQIYLNSINPLEPMFFISLLGMFLQILLMSSIVVAVSLIVKNEIVSILSSILILYGIDSVVVAGSYFNATGRFKIVFGYYGYLTHGALPTAIMTFPRLEEVFFAFSIPIIISTLLLIISLVYFRKIEVD